MLGSMLLPKYSCCSPSAHIALAATFPPCAPAQNHFIVSPCPRPCCTVLQLSARESSVQQAESALKQQHEHVEVAAQLTQREAEVCWSWLGQCMCWCQETGTQPAKGVKLFLCHPPSSAHKHNT